MMPPGAPGGREQRTKPAFVVVEDAAALAQSLAERFVVCARRATAERGRFDVALAGGSTPKGAYALLAAPPLAAGVSWNQVRFFFGDERCVPPGDPQSNYRMAREALLEPLRISDANVFRMRGEDEPPAAARSYAELLRRELGTRPVLDLVLLGMGPDGHTASLFPGTDPLSDDELLVRAPYVAKFSTYRITVTPRVINAARHVAIATAGQEKAQALAAVLEGPFEPITYPIQSIDPGDGDLTWLVDRAAASKLTRPL